MIVNLLAQSIAKPIAVLILHQTGSTETPSDNNQMMLENQSLLLLESSDVLMSEYVNA